MSGGAARREAGRVDPRAWLLWGIAAAVPPLVGRNPFVLAAVLLAVIGVRAAWAPTVSAVAAWGGILRLAVIFSTIGVLFNVLTVRAGDQPFARIPDGVPIIGGPLTVNALVYGLLSGAATLALVVTGTTVGAVADWPALLRLLPERLTMVAVAGSVAWTFVPQTAAAWREIYEAQLSRGHRPRGVRGLLPLLVPLLAGGLDRALTLAEALESRAFGAPLGAIAAPRRGQGVATVLGLTAGVVGAYLLAAGRPLPAVLGLMVATLCLGFAARDPGRAGGGERPRRTRYRDPVWGWSETTIAGAAGVALAVQIAVLALDPTAFAYDPYPTLPAPGVNLMVLAGLGLLLAPAAVAVAVAP